MLAETPSCRKQRGHEVGGPDTHEYPRFRESLPSGEMREGKYAVRFAKSREELDAVLRLRFEVFNLELGEGLETSFRTGRDLMSTTWHAITDGDRRDHATSSARIACKPERWRRQGGAFIRHRVRSFTPAGGSAGRFD